MYFRQRNISDQALQISKLEPAYAEFMEQAKKIELPHLQVNSDLYGAHLAYCGMNHKTGRYNYLYLHLVCCDDIQMHPPYLELSIAVFDVHHGMQSTLLLKVDYADPSSIERCINAFMQQSIHLQPVIH